MDLSKLPRLSQTPPPPPGHNPDAPPEPPVKGPNAPGFPVVPVGQAPETGQVVAPMLYCRCGAQLPPGMRFCSNCGASFAEATSDARADRPVGMGAEAWISIALGVILLFLSPRFWQWHLRRASFTWTSNDAAGNPLPYPQTAFYLADLGLAAFAVVMIVEGIVLLLPRRAVVIIAGLVLTAAAVVINIFALTKTYGVIGFQILNALAVAFGIYMAIFQVTLLQVLRGRR
jgi:hypothetical protein